MKLTDLNFEYPLKSTIYGERFLNDTKGRFEDYSEVNAKYDPQGSISHIELPFTWLPGEWVSVFKSEPPQQMQEWAVTNKGCRFFWHPDVERGGFVSSGYLRAQPTSSTRTLLTEEGPQVYIKTDLDKKHFRFIRRLQRSSVEHSVAVCRDLRHLCLNLSDKSRYAFLPESLGLVVCGGSHEGSGVIFRETTPYPRADDVRVMVPYHSLYADDPQKPSDTSLLVQMVELHGGKDKLGYFVSEIVGPVLEAWVLLVAMRGLLPELHGQNALAEIDTNFCIRRVVHRDFQSLYSDKETRTSLGLPMFAKHIVGQEHGTTIVSQYSIVFDNMISKYLLSRLARLFVKHYGIGYMVVCDAIKAYHHSLVGWHRAKFPETVYQFGSSSLEQVGNEVKLVDTCQPPLFR